MTAIRTETILSELLSAGPPVIQASTLLRALGLTSRPVNADFEASLELGFTESLDAWDARIGGRP